MDINYRTSARNIWNPHSHRTSHIYVNIAHVTFNHETVPVKQESQSALSKPRSWLKTFLEHSLLLSYVTGSWCPGGLRAACVWELGFLHQKNGRAGHRGANERSLSFPPGSYENTRLSRAPFTLSRPEVSQPPLTWHWWKSLC